MLFLFLTGLNKTIFLVLGLLPLGLLDRGLPALTLEPDLLLELLLLGFTLELLFLREGLLDLRLLYFIFPWLNLLSCVLSAHFLVRGLRTRE